jgi:predicted Rossmann fold flavoprotein
MGDTDRADIAIVGAGAAGLMAAIWAGREARRLGRPMRIVALDGARKIGVKILVAGGGRCNVTHHAVTEREYAGGSRNAIRSVLRAFTVDRTVAFFGELGVELKREETGKLFPTTDDAHTVLDALLGAVRDAGAELRHPCRVERVEAGSDGFTVGGAWGELWARRLVLATGGRALPKSGSDGGGYALARALGHSITGRVFPALVPMVLDEGCPVRGLSGVTVPARVELRSGTGKRLERFTNSTLCTHFGVSGPAVMDISRYYTAAHLEDRGAHLVVGWLPDVDADQLDAELRDLGGRRVGAWLRNRLPERMGLTLCEVAGVDPTTTGATMTRAERRSLVATLTEMRLPVTGDRGFTHAEATAGGVPLDEISVKTMGSRRAAGLHLCGEVCDVDGRIGGFNFQWAWSSGFVAGTSVARSE